MSIWKPSVTVAAIVEREGRFLLVEEETPDGVRLNQPAGHLDPGESLVSAAARECLEETARMFTPVALLGAYMSRYWSVHTGEDVTYLRFAYVGTVTEPEPGRALDTGILRADWFTVDEIRASVDRHRSPLVLRCVEDHLAGRRWPLEAVFTHPSVLEAR